MEYENDQRGYDGLSPRSVVPRRWLTVYAQMSLAAMSAIAAGHRALSVAMPTTRVPEVLPQVVATAGMSLPIVLTES
jgi:hypothetical protein